MRYALGMVLTASILNISTSILKSLKILEFYIHKIIIILTIHSVHFGCTCIKILFVNYVMIKSTNQMLLWVQVISRIRH